MSYQPEGEYGSRVDMPCDMKNGISLPIYHIFQCILIGVLRQH